MPFRIHHPTQIAFLSLVIAAGWFILHPMSNGAKGDGLQLTPGEYASGSKREKAVARKVTPGLKSALHEKGLKWGAPVFIRAFKEERILEVWIQMADQNREFKLFRTYPIAAASGDLGPKTHEGDRQVPEGFYYVSSSGLNPQSDFHLSFNIGYPNQYDLAHDRTGTFIMVHGSNVSVGCLAMTDEKIEEIYTLCNAALNNGQRFFRVHIFPFRMTSEQMTRHRGNRWFSFWQNLQTGFQWFEDKKIPPDASESNLTYQFR